MSNSKKISLSTSIFPIILLVLMLVYNIFNNEWLGTYTFHITLLITALTVSIIGLIMKVSIKKILVKIYKSVKSIKTPNYYFIISWRISRYMESQWGYSLLWYIMVLILLIPSVFLPLTLVITAIVSLTAGSSYITSATIGVALISVGNAFNIPPSMTAGAVISGAYFGDKMSPLSDTTNLASAISGADLYTHIKYMMYTTFPTFIITFITFCIITLNLNSSSSNDVIEIGMISEILKEDFYISPILFLIPTSVLILAYLKVKPVIALSLGVLFAIIFSIIFQNNILQQIDISTLKAIFSSVFTFTEIPLEVSYNTENTKLLDGINDLYTRGGMESMLWVIFLTICAMVFGGAMEAIGAY